MKRIPLWLLIPAALLGLSLLAMALEPEPECTWSDEMEPGWRCPPGAVPPVSSPGDSSGSQP